MVFVYGIAVRERARRVSAVGVECSTATTACATTSPTPWSAPEVAGCTTRPTAIPSATVPSASCLSPTRIAGARPCFPEVLVRLDRWSVFRRRPGRRRARPLNALLPPTAGRFWCTPTDCATDWATEDRAPCGNVSVTTSFEQRPSAWTYSMPARHTV